MDAIKFIKEYERMCNYYGYKCTECPIGINNNNLNIYCFDFRNTYQKECVEIVSKWSNEHPQITNREKFREVFGIDFYDAMTTLNWARNEYKEIK